jgi:hypothetical protein
MGGKRVGIQAVQRLEPNPRHMRLRMLDWSPHIKQQRLRVAPADFVQFPWCDGFHDCGCDVSISLSLYSDICKGTFSQGG